ncbi:hypothetical protein [Nostoc sp.]|uniref:hypothetical protein n=1 Tax=Nostoc sp. TaxID=1180 RepID=UPI002FFA52CE
MSPESLIQLSDSLRSLYIKTAQKLKGSDRRQFMAEVVKTNDIERWQKLKNKFNVYQT